MHDPAFDMGATAKRSAAVPRRKAIRAWATRSDHSLTVAALIGDRLRMWVASSCPFRYGYGLHLPHASVQKPPTQ